MPSASLKQCTYPGCSALVARGRCAEHRRQAERQRGNAAARGYDADHRRTFRAAVLVRDPVCTWRGCEQLTTDADHWPKSRRELEKQGLDPNDPKHGRGLCHDHHSQATAAQQPGGWHQPRR